MEPNNLDPRPANGPDPKQPAAQPHPSPCREAEHAPCGEATQPPCEAHAPQGEAEHAPAPSEARSRAARLNGAKSRGPITPEGKARSSRNATRHGLLSDTLVLEQENPEVLENLAASLHAHLQPANIVASILVDDIAAAFWRRNRIRDVETETYNIVMQAHESKAIDPTHALALAFRDLADNSHTLNLLNRYETRFDRQIVRTLRLLRELNPPGNNSCQTNPSPAAQPPSPTPTPTAPAPGGGTPVRGALWVRTPWSRPQIRKPRRQPPPPPNP